MDPAIPSGIPVVIQITDQVNVLREIELIIEEPYFHLTANKKLIKPSLTPKNRKQFPKPIEQSSKLFNLYNINPNSRSSLLPYVKIKFNNGISRALIDTGAFAHISVSPKQALIQFPDLTC